MDEYEAVARLKEGDIGGLETLVRSYQLRATRAAYLIVRDPPLAEDIVEEAFLRACQRIEQFDSTRPFGPWFLRSVVHAAQRAAAQRERHTSLERADAEGGTTLADLLADQTPGPEELVQRAEVQQAVWLALGKLSPAQRAAVVQRYYLGLSEDEMAIAAGCAPGTVKWRLHEARERLRERLRPLHRALQ